MHGESRGGREAYEVYGGNKRARARRAEARAQHSILSLEPAAARKISPESGIESIEQ